jgi:DNA-binding protein
LSDTSNVVYIGRKPTMNYVLALMTTFYQEDTGEAVLKARGRAISRAIDVAEITRRRFLNDLAVDNISIGTEELEQDDGTKRNVSTMEITLKKKKG